MVSVYVKHHVYLLCSHPDWTIKWSAMSLIGRIHRRSLWMRFQLHGMTWSFMLPAFQRHHTSAWQNWAGKATGVVVVPHWPAQVWWPLLIRLLRRDPVPLTAPRTLSRPAQTDTEKTPPPPSPPPYGMRSIRQRYLQAGFSRPKHQAAADLLTARKSF